MTNDNTIILAAILMASLAFFLTPYIIKVLGRGFSGEQFEYAVLLTRIGLPTLMISSVVGIFRGSLESEELFVKSAIAELPTNIVYLFYLFFLAQYFSITALMVIAMFAEASKLLIQIPSMKKVGYRYKLIIDLDDKYMSEIATLIPPILLSVGIGDLNNLVDKSMASTLVEGSVSALTYAGVLNGVVFGVFITAIATVVFPILSKEANAKNYEQLKYIMQRSLNIVLLITVPAAIGMIVLATPAVKFAYQRGQFGEVAAMMTSSALVYYSIGLIGAGVNYLIVHVFYALQDTKTPMKNSFYGLVLNISFNLLFVQSMGHNGLALATSVSTTLTELTLLYSLRKKIGNLGLTRIIRSSSKIMAASLVMGGTVYLVYHFSMRLLDPSRLTELLLLVLTIALGGVVYVVFLYLLKVDELYFFMNYIKDRIAMKK